MTRDEFEHLVAQEFTHAIPEKFRPKITNVAFLVEDDPSQALRDEEGLGARETLLGHYRGVPHTSRGNFYGMGHTLPDTITLFQNPIEELAQQAGGGEDALRKAIRDTIWHEVAHHFGMEEHEVRAREAKRN